MSQAKMQWTTPQLIVLARGTPEETLTLNCKIIEPGVVGATDNTQAGCQEIDSPSQCGACQARTGS